jgi:membrane associated rhomboid family serine protease
MTPHPSDLDRLAPATLTAGSRRQAMDWGLVLISQGIPAVIEREELADLSEPSSDPETASVELLTDPARSRIVHELNPRFRRSQPSRRSRSTVWCLRVEPASIERARAVIDEYRRENPRFDWQRSAATSAASDRSLSWAPGVVAWALVLCLLHGLLPTVLRSAGWVEVAAVRQYGQWWRLFTATWLHADVAHLASNVGTGALTLGLAMGRYGPGTALSLSLLAGTAANIPGVLLREPTARALGASGVVMAALGLLAGHAVVWWRISRHASRPVWISLGAGGFLFLSLGVNPASDVLAHAGGFFGGILLGALAAWFRWGRYEKLWALAYAVLTVGPWLCAWAARGR